MHSDIRKRAAGAYSLSAPLILAVLNTSALRAQLAPPPLKFEVASIKPNRSGAVRTAMMPYPEGRLIAENNSLKQLVRAAFGVKDFQVSGGPDWFDADRFDIVAKAEGPASKEQLLQMLQSLLVDRFKLVSMPGQSSSRYSTWWWRSGASLDRRSARTPGPPARLARIIFSAPQAA